MAELLIAFLAAAAPAQAHSPRHSVTNGSCNSGHSMALLCTCGHIMVCDRGSAPDVPDLEEQGADRGLRPVYASSTGHFTAQVTAVIAECGTSKTLMALSAIHVHSSGRPYSALVTAPPNIVGKWCREVLIKIPGARVFIIDALRTPGQSGANPHGVNEVRYRNGRIVREGPHTTLTDLRLRKNPESARDRWRRRVP